MREDSGKEPEAPRIPRWLVMWECPVCGGRLSGYLAAGDDTMRACKSPNGPKLPADYVRKPGDPRPNRALPKGELCGEILRVTLDERRRREPVSA
jgi:hypothetical protein